MLFTLVSLDIHEGCMKAILFAGSVEFEFEQEYFQADRDASVSDLDATAKARSFPMLEVAMQTAEKRAVTKVNVFLFHNEVWNVMIPSGSRTAKLRCVGYRLLSGTQGHIEESLVRKGTTFPALGFLADFAFAHSQLVIATNARVCYVAPVTSLVMHSV